jgi:hypothetical protein
MPQEYWCEECNRETYFQEELISASGSFRGEEPYCPEGHEIDVYGKEQLVEKFAMILSGRSLEYATSR